MRVKLDSEPICVKSTVGFPPVPHARYGNGVFARLFEKYPIVSTPQAKADGRWPQLLYVPIAGAEVAVDAMQNRESNFAIDGAKIGTRLRGPLDC